MKKFIFDLEGTLTPLDGRMNKDFENTIFNALKYYDGYLVTNLNIDGVINKIDIETYKVFKTVYDNVYDKSLILKDFDLSNDNIYFFGDSIFPNGDDFSIVKQLYIHTNNIYRVRSWKDTEIIFRELIDI
jgi:glutamine cyclotransferase